MFTFVTPFICPASKAAFFTLPANFYFLRRHFRWYMEVWVGKGIRRLPLDLDCLCRSLGRTNKIFIRALEYTHVWSSRVFLCLVE